MSPLGETTLDLVNPKTNSAYSVDFIVVPNNFTCLLGYDTLKDLDLFSVNEHLFDVASLSVKDITKKYPSVFDGQLGNLPGTVKLHVPTDCEPQILPACWVSVALGSEVKKELDRLTGRDVLVPIDELTEWVNQMTVAQKRNGSLRLCIDPAPLNATLISHKFDIDLVFKVTRNRKFFAFGTF